MKDRRLTLLTLAVLVAPVCLVRAQSKSLSDPAPQANPRYEEITLQKYDKFKDADPDILFIGDSITEQWLNAERGLPVWKKVFEPLKSACYGFGGDGTQHVLWRLERVDWKGIFPKVVILMIGTNNGDKGKELFEAQKKIVQKLNELFPAANIVFIPVLPRDKGYSGKTLIFSVNAMADRLTRECKNVTILNLTDRLTDNQKKVRPELYFDGLHLSTAGYQVMADALLPLVNEKLAN